MNPTVDAVLARAYPSFHEPLRIAWQLNRGGPADLDSAARLLDALTLKYPAALSVWFEAAFNRVRRIAPLRDPAERATARQKALELLHTIDGLFGGRLDEDTYALWGRCHKDAGHEHLDRGLALPASAGGPDEAEREPASPLVRSGAAGAAEAEYLKAEEQYDKGYRLKGNWFPGINVAFLRFLRAALAAQAGRVADSARLLREAQARAGELLAATGWAVKLPDDDIWHEATRGEARALRAEWDAAVAHYRNALARPGLQPYHPVSMGGQLRRVVQGWELLGQKPPADLKDQLPQLFPSPTA